MYTDTFESLVSAMWCCEANMPNKNDIVSDEIIKNKIDNMQVLNQKDKDGKNLLMFATIYQRPVIVEYLLKKELNANEQDKNGFTALHFAVQANRYDIVKILLEYGSDANLRNKFGNIPLMLSNNITPIEIFKILIDNGSNIYCPNNFGVSVVDIFKNQCESVQNQSEDTVDG